MPTLSKLNMGSKRGQPRKDFTKMELNDLPHDGDDEAKQRWFKAKTAEMWHLEKLTRDPEEAAEYQEERK